MFKEELEKPILFSLSEIEKTYEREVFSFMAALGDFGGFNDGVVLIPALFMSFYSQKMFAKELFSLLPTKSSSNHKSRDKINEKFSANSSPLKLSNSDAELLAEESKRMKKKKNSWLYNLCFFKRLCKEERGMRLQKKAIEHFEN